MSVTSPERTPLLSDLHVVEEGSPPSVPQWSVDHAEKSGNPTPVVHKASLSHSQPIELCFLGCDPILWWFRLFHILGTIPSPSFTSLAVLSFSSSLPLVRSHCGCLRSGWKHNLSEDLRRLLHDSGAGLRLPLLRAAPPHPDPAPLRGQECRHSRPVDFSRSFLCLYWSHYQRRHVAPSPDPRSNWHDTRWRGSRLFPHGTLLSTSYL